MTLEQGIGVSNAKIILIGEHAAVYGKPAIVVPLTAVKLTAITTPIEQGQLIESNYYTGPLARSMTNFSGIKKLIQTILTRLNQQQANFKLTITSQIPAERGMGSSAATAVAVTRSLYDFFGKKLNRATLLELANVAETVTHGSPSGMDAATTSSTAPIWFIKGHASYNLPINLSGNLVIADSGIRGQTGPAVTTVRERLADFPQETAVFLDQLAELAESTRKAIASQQLAQVGKNFTSAQLILQTLGVSNETIDHLVFVAQRNGSLGTKLTGGGRGGCIIALTADDATTQHLLRALAAEGVTQTWVQPLAHLNQTKNQEYDHE
ncbi:mevalonate kinase [Loigolactobacillus jiayinensis]|uniref:Mevalonate kinase n=1 Tax=Loigolactobacillus jiayinensis TaxID=2486016 RepID=A0ABW1RD66_9LACO|nr:mevalonate kinase [Loigolactobacillus jiayinensis]